MCCLVTSLALLGPRAALIIWWILQPARWELAFSSWLWPLIGFFLAPWTTLTYVAVAPGGLVGFDWVLLALGIFLDIAMWTGGAWGNRDRIPGSSATA